MNELVIVTTWLREALLFLCLEAIRSEGPPVQPIYVFSDRGANSPALEFVTDHFGAVRIVRDQHHRYGNSWNLLDALCWAVKNKRPKIVHIVEDDVILHRGYLAWARESLREVTAGTQLVPAAVCGRIPSPHIPNWYESPCASWDAGCLGQALSHLTPEYMEATSRLEMQRLLDERMFPGSRYRRGGAEQDGFLLRCIEHHKWTTLFPPKPLATHLGFHGYNRPKEAKGPSGSLDEQIAFCRRLLADRQKRTELFGKGITEKEMEGMSA